LPKDSRPLPAEVFIHKGAAVLVLHEQVPKSNTNGIEGTKSPLHGSTPGVVV
jgi:hypothetical protein